MSCMCTGIMSMARVEHGVESGVFTSSGQWFFSGCEDEDGSAATQQRVVARGDNSTQWTSYAPVVPRDSMFKHGYISETAERFFPYPSGSLPSTPSTGVDCTTCSLPTDGNPTNEVLSGFLHHNGTMAERMGVVINNTPLERDIVTLVREYDAEVEINRLLCVTAPVVFSVMRTRSQMHDTWAGVDAEANYMNTLLAYNPEYRPSDADSLGCLIEQWQCLNAHGRNTADTVQASMVYKHADPISQSHQLKWEHRQEWLLRRNTRGLYSTPHGGVH
jgi:hypothetical protein